ncbi:hypothetical protein ACLK1S_25325 [Escherichia coli]
MKLARELSKRGTGRCCTTRRADHRSALRPDIQQLLDVLHKLRDQAIPLWRIRTDLDVIKTADWIVDLGREGGSGGG